MYNNQCTYYSKVHEFLNDTMHCETSFVKWNWETVHVSCDKMDWKGAKTWQKWAMRGSVPAIRT